MAFIDDIAEFLNDTVSHSPINTTTPRDVHGAPNYQAALDYSARVVRKSKMVRSASGDEVLSSFHVWIGSSADTNLESPPNVDPRDKITLSDGDIPTILAVEQFPDETATLSHTKVYFR